MPGLECRFKLPIPTTKGPAARRWRPGWSIGETCSPGDRSSIGSGTTTSAAASSTRPTTWGTWEGSPSHPELLDWLAVEFRDGGGSLKKLHRLIVTSAHVPAIVADRSRTGPAVDAENRLLWRMNRQRLDAETVRDAVLQISGKLDLTMGGPSVKQFVEIAGHSRRRPNVDYQSFDVDAPGNFRRSIYRFSVPHPSRSADGVAGLSRRLAVRRRCGANR